MSNALIILCYCIVAYGACNVIAFGKGPANIFIKFRDLMYRISTNLGELFECMMCLPANFGWICSLFNWFLINEPFTPFNLILRSNPSLWWLAMICDGAFTSGIVWLIHTIQAWFENNSGTQVLETDEEITNE